MQRIPVAEVVGELVPGALHGPAFDPPVVALQQADEIEKPAAAHRIVHDVAARPDPVGADVELDARRHLIARNQAAPRNDAGELRPVGAEQASRTRDCTPSAPIASAARAGSPVSN